MDGFGWYNNSGAITIDVSTLGSPPSPPVSVPEPATPFLMALGIVALCVRRYLEIRHC
ncbi:MAG: PEP-CTERM sorting domain-containing protein [Marinobacter sp.]|uniref:PEP-CTERM sorting domain-containing protein n=1 Tax=Marinobacter sp. TaxID=50741 RepID=UPI003F9DC1B6